MHGDHHAVAHALGTRVVIRPIRDVSQRPVGIRARLEVKPLFLAVAVEKLLKSSLDLGVALGGRVTEFGKQVAILVCLVGAVPVTRHPGNVSKGSVDMRRTRVRGLRLRRFGRRLCRKARGHENDKG